MDAQTTSLFSLHPPSPVVLIELATSVALLLYFTYTLLYTCYSTLPPIASIARARLSYARDRPRIL